MIDILEPLRYFSDCPKIAFKIPIPLKLNAIMGSDIGHWDVPDMTKVMVEAYEMVEDGLMTEEDFRAFSFGNVAAMHKGMNPDFFKGPVVEDAVAELTVN